MGNLSGRKGLAHEKVCLLGWGMGWSQEMNALSQLRPGWHLRGAGGVQLSGAWDPGAEAAGVRCVREPCAADPPGRGSEGWTV